MILWGKCQALLGFSWEEFQHSSTPPENKIRFCQVLAIVRMSGPVFPVASWLAVGWHVKKRPLLAKTHAGGLLHEVCDIGHFGHFGKSS
jgi:hypothetical protein